MSSINFDNVYLLLLAIPLAILLIVPFAIAVKKENANVHNIVSGVFHVLIAVMIALSAAGTSIEITKTETDVYVVADVSYSSEKNLDTLDNYIQNLSDNLPKNSKMGVVCFGKDQELLVGLGKRLKSVRECEGVDKSETDIEGALEYTGALFRSNVIRRIVLITDGKQTHLSDSNALKRAVDSLKAADIYVDAIYLDNNLSQDAKEVQISSVEASQNTYINRAETAKITLQSTYDVQAELTLYKGGEAVSKQAVALKSGANVAEFAVDTSAQGSYDYEVRVKADGDENELNNNIKFSQSVSDKIRVLLLAGEQIDEEAVREAYGARAEIDAYNFSIDEMLPEVPYTVEELCAYDEFVISNADVAKLDYNCQAFLESLEKAVSLFGKGLITYGNTFLQSKKDEEFQKAKTLNDMLPVNFGNADRDAKLYALVIDASYSMRFDEKMSMAKAAARQLVQFLNEGDSVAVITFNGNFEVVQDVAQVSDKSVTGGKSKREQVLEVIDGIETAQGTLLSGGMQMAYDKLNALNTFDKKQVMLITDGITFSESGATDDPVTIATKMWQDDIAVSVLDVARVMMSEKTEAQTIKEMLESIASTGGGSYFYAERLSELEDVVFGEIADKETEAIIEQPSLITVKKRSDESLADMIDLNGREVGGYVMSKGKSSATSVLTVAYQKDSGKNVQVPLYSYWNYGNGRVSTFTSSIGGTWLDSWGALQKNTFAQNVFSQCTPREKVDFPFRAELREENGYLAVEVTPAIVRSGVEAKITVVSPAEAEGGESETQSAQMAFSSSHYTYSFETSRLGKYEIAIDYMYPDGRSYRAAYTYTLSYLPEYDSFTPFDSTALHRMIGSDGTVSEDGYLRIENDESRIGKFVLDLRTPLLVACVVLFAADVIARKLKWEDIRSLFGKGKK